MRLLIAEDEQEIGRVLKTILERSRYSVDWVDNGADALDYILTGNYDGISRPGTGDAPPKRHIPAPAADCGGPDPELLLL